MNLQPPTLSMLFAQLGLASDEAGIEAFIDSHHLPPDIKVSEAPFWTDVQKNFLRGSMNADGDWARAVDELNECLHA
ncbi:DUF2789 domain-containing protein [Pseudomonas akapageensis]|uniref:DUF2789 domain-containing protein n=1 Tax=Pseudomonas akapageensis TaxID=2609961 RepID=UPI00140E3804|nr:DUF2789 domain-containing protein [Pseudomonas akapageensis]